QSGVSDVVASSPLVERSPVRRSRFNSPKHNCCGHCAGTDIADCTPKLVVESITSRSVRPPANVTPAQVVETNAHTLGIEMSSSRHLLGIAFLLGMVEIFHGKIAVGTSSQPSR